MPVDTISISDVTDEAGTQAELSAWQSSTAPTSIDHTDFIKAKRNRGLYVIWYTA